MGKVEIFEAYTPKDPLNQMGLMAGVCWGAKNLDEESNIKRALSCIESGHGRVLEFPQVYLLIDGYSAKVIREFYTHIGGGPTRLQESTRYINYGDFEYVNPCKTEQGKKYFDNLMVYISEGIKDLEAMGEVNENATMALPLAYQTKIVFRTDLRMLIEMGHQRFCSRAYWEYRDLMNNIKNVLSDYSEQWKIITDKYFVPKCLKFGYCTEEHSCGMMPKKGEV